MKRIIAFIIAFMLTLSFLQNVYAAPDYGEEWANMTETVTNTFSDVNTEHWAYDAIMRVVEKKWFAGYPNGKFKPDGTITRAEALKVFVVFLGLEIQNVEESTFYDVDIDAWYAPYIEAGKDLFPTHTTIQGKIPFQPDMPVTREDTIYALVRALGYDVGVKYNDQSVLNMFTDQDSISTDLRKYFTIALEEELVYGFPDDTIRAQDSLTRAEFATLLYRGSFKGNSGRHEAKVLSVTVTPSEEIELEIGEEITLSARATYTDGANKSYEELNPYIVSNNGVIKLSGTKITALKSGTTSIKYNDEFLKDEILNVVVTIPSTAPKLKITDYDEITEEASATIKGTVTDESGEEVDLTCNNKDIDVKSNGSFTATVKLSIGINEFEFVATNIYGVETVKTIKIERISPKEPKEEPEEPKESETETSTTLEPENSVVETETTMLNCDVNKDGTVNEADSQCIIDVRYNDKSKNSKYNYDVNGDGKIDHQDLKEVMSVYRPAGSATGDINFDGKTDGQDIQLLQTIIYDPIDNNGNIINDDVIKTITEKIFSAADMTDDGRLNISDVRILINKVVK